MRREFDAVIIKKKETRTFEVYFLERIRKTNDEHRSYLTVMRMRGMQIDEIIAKRNRKIFRSLFFKRTRKMNDECRSNLNRL